VLQTNGSGVLSFSSPSSDFVLLATTDASSSASVSFDGYFSSTYQNYKIIISNAIAVNNDRRLLIRFRKSNADITTGNYRGIVDGAAGNDGGSNMGASWYYNATSMSEPTVNTLINTTIWGGLMMEINLYNPLNTNNYKYVTYQAGYINNDATQWYINNGTGLLTDNASALSGITFFMNTGNIASGNFKLYGIK
jgi:hypothetical protein